MVRTSTRNKVVKVAEDQGASQILKKSVSSQGINLSLRKHMANPIQKYLKENENRLLAHVHHAGLPKSDVTSQQTPLLLFLALAASDGGKRTNASRLSTRLRITLRTSLKRSQACPLWTSFLWQLCQQADPLQKNPAELHLKNHPNEAVLLQRQAKHQHMLSSRRGQPRIQMPSPLKHHNRLLSRHCSTSICHTNRRYAQRHP